MLRLSDSCIALVKNGSEAWVQGWWVKNVEKPEKDVCSLLPFISSLGL